MPAPEDALDVSSLPPTTFAFLFTFAFAQLQEPLESLRQEIEAVREDLDADGRAGISPLLTRDEAADHLRVSTRTLDTMEAAGELRAVRIRGRVLYHRDTLDAFIRARTER